MRDIKSFIVAAAFGALTVVSSGVMAQAADGRFLSLTPPEGLPVGSNDIHARQVTATQ